MDKQELILIVEDEAAIMDFLTVNLEANGYRVLQAASGKEAVSLASSHCPNLIMLDLGLPDIDGLEVLESVRAWGTMPIIIVSARQQEEDIICALDLGADDYITKPFINAVLMARVRTALRRNANLNGGAASVLSFNNGQLVVDKEKRLVLLDGNAIHLTPSEYKILVMLADNGGKVITYNQICKQLWGPYTDDTRTLRVNMANLRRKLEKNSADPVFIKTEIGVGYRMLEADET